MITIQEDSFDWNDSRTTLQLWVLSDRDWIEADGTLHGEASPGSAPGRIFARPPVTGLTNNTTAKQLTIPDFDVPSTRDAIRGNNARLYFWIMAVNGSAVSKIKPVPGTDMGLAVPATLPIPSWAELIAYNTPLPAPARETYLDDIERLIRDAVVGISGIGAVDDAGKTTKGAQIVSTDLFLQTADADFPGLVSTDAQSFAGIKTFIDGAAIVPVTITYSQLGNTFGFGVAHGGLAPSTPATYNVPSGKQYSAEMVALTNSGAGKMMGYEFNLNATGATQDAAEPVRGVFGRVTNSLASGASKTVAIRVGATGLNGSDAYLAAFDGDVTLSPDSNISTSVFSGTLFSVSGAVDDRASGLMLWANNNERYLMGVGMTGPLKFSAAVYRAWLATGSHALARGFQQMNNAGTEIFYTDINGVINTTGGIRMANGVSLGQRNAADTLDVDLIKLNAADEILLGNNTQILTANPYLRLGSTAAGWVMQMVDSDERWRLNKNDTGEIFAVLKTVSSAQVGMQVYVNDGAVTSLRQVTVGAVDSGGSGFRLLRVPN